MKLFDPDHIFMRILTAVTNLILLNWMFLLCSIPLVTLGASLTALHSVTLQMIRGEEPGVVSTFLRAFRENFLQGTVLFFLMLAFGLVIVGDFVLIPVLMRGIAVLLFGVVAVVLLFLWLMMIPYLFPLQARFVNTVGITVKNAAIMGMTNLPSTILVLGLSAVIPAFLYVFPGTLPFVLQLSLFVLFSGQVYWMDRIVYRVFLKAIPAERELLEKWNADKNA